MFRLSFLVAAALLVCMAAVQNVSASPYFTAPVASTTANGGGRLQAKWTDSKKSPQFNAKDWGNATLWLAAGSESSQFKLQMIKQNFAPTRHSISFTVDKTIGPSGQYYFMRMEGSEKGSDGYPVMAFSARFKLDGMSGKFNQTVLQAAMGKEGSSSDGSNSGGSSSKSMSTSTTPLSTSPTPNSAAASSGNNTSDAGRLNVVSVFVGTGALVAAALTMA